MDFSVVRSPVGIVGALWSSPLRIALVALFVVYFVLWVLTGFRAMRHRTIELLCETEWARTRKPRGRRK